MTDDLVEILFQSFQQKAIVSSSGIGKDVHSLVLSIQHFLCRKPASPILQGALKDGFGEAGVACDIPEPCKFPSSDSCQKRFLWTQKEVYLAPNPVIGLMLQVGDTENFPQALGFRKPGSFLYSVIKQGLSFIAIWEDVGGKRLVQLACEGAGRGKRKVQVRVNCRSEVKQHKSVIISPQLEDFLSI